MGRIVVFYETESKRRRQTTTEVDRTIKTFFGLMRRLWTFLRQIYSRSTELTFSGTDLMRHKTCVTTVD